MNFHYLYVCYYIFIRFFFCLYDRKKIIKLLLSNQCLINLSTKINDFLYKCFFTQRKIHQLISFLAIVKLLLFPINKYIFLFVALLNQNRYFLCSYSSLLYSLPFQYSLLCTYYCSHSLFISSSMIDLRLLLYLSIYIFNLVTQYIHLNIRFLPRVMFFFLLFISLPSIGRYSLLQAKFRNLKYSLLNLFHIFKIISIFYRLISIYTEPFQKKTS